MTLGAQGDDAGTLAGLTTKLLSDILPRTLLEGYAALVAASSHAYGGPSAVVVCNYGADEVQNEFLARCVTAGYRIAFAQHGGFYMQAPVNAQERLELRAGCEFWSWGRSARAIRVANPRVERLRASHRGGDSICLIEGPHPPDTSVMRFASTPLANQAFDAPRRLAAFVDAVTPAARQRIRLKRYPAVIGSAPRLPALEKLATTGPARAQQASAWMQRSAMTVVSYPDTPFIEALVIGVPTIGLWNPHFWEWRPELADAVEELERVHVIFADPAAAAAHLSAVIDDPEAWWSAPSTLAARGAFVDLLAPPGDWLSDWASGLGRLAARPA